MRAFAILLLIALGLAVYGCGNNNPPNAVETTTSGNWEATLTGGTGPAANLDFVINFSVTNTTGQSAVGLAISGFSFINAGACFQNGITATAQGGSATITTLSTGQVNGTMSLTINSLAPSTTPQGGNSLQLTADPSSGGGVAGTSNGTTATTGTLSNGVVWGVWNLSSTNSTNTGCGGTKALTGRFIMCQNATTCTIPGT